jgi:hypothetical protein
MAVPPELKENFTLVYPLPGENPSVRELPPAVFARHDLPRARQILPGGRQILPRK